MANCVVPLKSLSLSSRQKRSSRGLSLCLYACLSCVFASIAVWVPSRNVSQSGERAGLNSLPAYAFLGPAAHYRNPEPMTAGSPVLVRPSCHGRRDSLVARSAATLPLEPRIDLLSPRAKKGSGGGKGGEPTDLQKLQVIVFRCTFFLGALCYLVAFILDFLGGNLIGWAEIIPDTAGAAAADSQVAGWTSSVLRLGDLLTSLAALTVPMGSLLIGSLVLRVLGGIGVCIAAAGLGAPGMLGAVAGPLCVVIILAREVYWFGLTFKVDAAVGLLLFTAIVLLRISDATTPSTGFAVSEAVTSEEDLMYGIATATEATTTGPPLPLSALSSTIVLLVSFGKLFESIGEDVDEDGEQWQKRSTTLLPKSEFEESDARGKASEGVGATEEARKRSPAEDGN